MPVSSSDLLGVSERGRERPAAGNRSAYRQSRNGIVTSRHTRGRRSTGRDSSGRPGRRVRSVRGSARRASSRCCGRPVGSVSVVRARVDAEVVVQRGEDVLVVHRPRRRPSPPRRSVAPITWPTLHAAAGQQGRADRGQWSRPPSLLIRGVRPNSPQTTIDTSSSMPRSSRSVTRACRRVIDDRQQLPHPREVLRVRVEVAERHADAAHAGLDQPAGQQQLPGRGAVLAGVEAVGVGVDGAACSGRAPARGSLLRSRASANRPEVRMLTACWVKRSIASIVPLASRSRRTSSKPASSRVAVVQPLGGRARPRASAGRCGWPRGRPAPSSSRLRVRGRTSSRCRAGTGCTSGRGSRAGRCCGPAAGPASGPRTAGTGSRGEPRSLATTEPSAGRPPSDCRSLAGNPDWHWKASCAPAEPTSERMKANLVGDAGQLRHQLADAACRGPSWRSA